MRTIRVTGNETIRLGRAGENPGTFRKAGYDQQRLPYRDEEQIRWWFTVQSAQVWSCGRHYYQGSVPRQGGGIR